MNMQTASWYEMEVCGFINSKVFIGGLSYGTTDGSLLDRFLL